MMASILLDGYLAIFIPFLLGFARPLHAAVVAGGAWKEVCTQDTCVDALMKSLAELQLDIKFAYDLLKDNKPARLAELKLRELDSTLIEHSLGLDRTEAMLKNSTERLINLLDENAELCRALELPAKLTCFIGDMSENLDFLEGRTVHLPSLLDNFRESFSSLRLKLADMDSLLQGITLQTTAHNSDSTRHLSDHERLELAKAFFEGQLECSRSIQGSLYLAETLSAQSVATSGHMSCASLAASGGQVDSETSSLVSSGGVATLETAPVVEEVENPGRRAGVRMDGPPTGAAEERPRWVELDEALEGIERLVRERSMEVKMAEHLCEQVSSNIRSGSMENLIDSLKVKLRDARLILNRVA